MEAAAIAVAAMALPRPKLPPSPPPSRPWLKTKKKLLRFHLLRLLIRVLGLPSPARL
jgi:hypothetical protein